MLFIIYMDFLICRCLKKLEATIGIPFMFKTFVKHWASNQLSNLLKRKPTRRANMLRCLTDPV